VKRRGRADDVLALVSDAGFQRKLAHAVRARGKVETTPADVRKLAVSFLPPGALDGVQVTFRWSAERQRVDVRVKRATTAVDDQGAGA
jgi:hypothetical protein